MNKFVPILLVLILVSVVSLVSGFHRSWLNNAEAETILRNFEEDLFRSQGTDIMRYIAPLPERDRALLAYYCEDIHAQMLRNVGTREVINAKEKPGCQALVKGGWHPKWTIADGLEYLREPGSYRIR